MPSFKDSVQCSNVRCERPRSIFEALRRIVKVLSSWSASTEWNEPIDPDRSKKFIFKSCWSLYDITSSICSSILRSWHKEVLRRQFFGRWFFCEMWEGIIDSRRLLWRLRSFDGTTNSCEWEWTVNIDVHYKSIQTTKWTSSFPPIAVHRAGICQGRYFLAPKAWGVGSQRNGFGAVRLYAALKCIKYFSIRWDSPLLLLWNTLLLSLSFSSGDAKNKKNN